MKAMGALRGWFDLTIILHDDQNAVSCPNKPRTVWLELKTVDGELSKDQIALHAKSKALGMEVHTIYANSPENAWQQIISILQSV